MITDPQSLHDEPLNLEQDKSIQCGRMSTPGQDSSLEVIPDLDFPQGSQPCCQEQRELHQCDFLPWMQ